MLGVPHGQRLRESRDVPQRHDPWEPACVHRGYRGESLIRNSAPLGPYSRNMSRALWWSYGGGAVSYKQGTPIGVGVWIRVGVWGFR
jgi:hypothetical protein